MNEEIKQAGEKAAEIFLATMPEKTFGKFEKKKLHHQLSYFFCWCEIMKEDESNET